MTFRKDDYFVAPLPLAQARWLVETYHYAGGASNTAVYLHGLFLKAIDFPVGVAWWLPPTRVACESVNKPHWRKCLGLSRLVVIPGIPKNACSFLLAKSIKLIARDRRFVSLVTYADESQGHSGCVYRASNWAYVGRTGPYPRWVTAQGKQVSVKATKSRTVDQMKALGHTRAGSFFKHKFVYHLAALA